MPFDIKTKNAMFIACNRRCCLCLKQCGTNIEAAHIVAEAEGGSNEQDNGIPLCFDCHQEAGSYNDQHPRGNKIRPDELRARRDRVYLHVADGRLWQLEPRQLVDGQLVHGWSESLPEEYKNMVCLELTTPPPTSRYISRGKDGQFRLVYWDCVNRLYKWEPISSDYARDTLEPVRRYMNADNWLDLF